MTLLALSLAPVVIIAAYVYFRDKYEKEPVYLLLLSLFAGAFITLPIVITESILAKFSVNLDGFSKPAWHAFVVAGFTEEFFKYLALYLLIWKSREFNEKFDGIVYAVFISLGFAAIENIMYVAEGGHFTGLMRAFTAVPAHAAFGVTMGFFFGYARFRKRFRFVWKIKALVYPIILHGIYDFIIMVGIDWMLIVFVGFLIFLIVFALKRIRKLSAESTELIENTMPDLELIAQINNPENDENDTTRI